MAERPILFSGAMVRAILEGRKSQTRRVVKGRGSRGLPEFHGGRGEENDPSAWGWFFDGPDHHGYEVLARGLDERHDHGLVSMPCPFGRVGDRLWVRETWGLRKHFDFTDWHRRSLRAIDSLPPEWMLDYRADWQQDHEPNFWRPSIHMPRWASRLTLEVTCVRVERLNAISEEDAKAEGADRDFTPCDPDDREDPREVGYPSASDTAHAEATKHRRFFRSLWESINGPDSWKANPWVWAITFKRVTP